MTRYTTESNVKLVLRAPQKGVASWTDDTYAALLTNCIEAAETYVDDYCAGWAPFDTAPIAEERSFAMDGAYGFSRCVVTPPYTIAPTQLSLDGVTLTRAVLEPQHMPRATRSGKNLYVYTQTSLEGQTITVSGGTWGWTEVPAEVQLATERIAARKFTSMRNRHMGVISVEGAAMYEPRYDDEVSRLLAPYRGAETL